MPVILRKGQAVWEVGINSPCLKPGNGPMTLKYGCIILGKAVASAGDSFSGILRPTL